MGSLLKKIILANKKWSDLFREQFESICFDANYTEELEACMKQFSCNGIRILEAGGIDRPVWYKSPKWEYDGLDIEFKENCHDIYDYFYVQSIEKPINGKYDLIISRTLLEHVSDNEKAFYSIYNSLNKNGVTVHYLPSKYHPYSLILRIVGPRLQRYIISKLRPWSVNTGYPTFFNYCSPSQMKKLLLDIGYTDVKVKCYYHANDYFSFCFPLFLLIVFYENICKLLNMKSLCCGFLIEAHK